MLTDLEPLLADLAAPPLRLAPRRYGLVTACDGGRHGLFLHRGRLGVTGVSQCFQDMRVQAKGFKRHLCLSKGVRCPG